MDRKCTLCQQILNINKFGLYFDKRRHKHYFFTWCKRCHSIKNVAARRNISYEFAVELYKRPCAICKRSDFTSTRQQHIDHCHKTGRVRGLLCNSCNLYIREYERKGHNKRAWQTLYAQKKKRYVPTEDEMKVFIES